MRKDNVDLQKEAQNAMDRTTSFKIEGIKNRRPLLNILRINEDSSHGDFGAHWKY